MDKEYFYSEEKDALLEGYIEELSSIPDKEERTAFLGKIPIETRYELLSYLRWETAKEEHKREDLQEKNKDLQEKSKALQSERGSIEMRFEEAILFLENGVTGSIIIGEA